VFSDSLFYLMAETVKPVVQSMQGKTDSKIRIAVDKKYHLYHNENRPGREGKAHPGAAQTKGKYLIAR
jgi:hypothetical protein